MKAKQYDTVAELITKTYRRLHPMYKDKRLSEKALYGMGIKQLDAEFNGGEMPIFVMREVMNNLKSGRFFDKPTFYSFYVMRNYIVNGLYPWGEEVPNDVDLDNTKGIRFTKSSTGYWSYNVVAGTPKAKQYPNKKTVTYVPVKYPEES